MRFPLHFPGLLNRSRRIWIEREREKEREKLLQFPRNKSSRRITICTVGCLLVLHHSTVPGSAALLRLIRPCLLITAAPLLGRNNGTKWVTLQQHCGQGSLLSLVVYRTLLFQKTVTTSRSQLKGTYKIKGMNQSSVTNERADDVRFRMAEWRPASRWKQSQGKHAGVDKSFILICRQLFYIFIFCTDWVI